MTREIELGIDTFGDVTVDADGNRLPQAQVIRDVVELATLADGVGVDVIGLGEHHRADFAVPSPEMVLAAIASRTERIRLASAVTVLSSDDPVRVYERFSTLDAISKGRAEIIMGRGSFTESFPLFGFDMADYELLFDEKLQLFAQLLDDGPVTWSGTMRAPLHDQLVYPRPESGTIRTWVGVGGNPQSVVRAATYGLALFLAIIGGDPRRFAPLVELYHRALDEFGQAMQPVAAHSPGHVAETDEEAKAQLWPHYKLMHDQIGGERGWGPLSLEAFEHAAGPHGSLYVGSPGTVATKIAATVEALGLERFTLKIASGPQPHAQQMASVELYGTEVVPRVRELLGSDRKVDRRSTRDGAGTPAIPNR